MNSQAIPAALRRTAIPRAVLGVLRRLDAAGFRSWLVGGAIRDLLLHRGQKKAADFDVATPARPEEVKKLFRRVIPTGIDHGTVTVLEGDDRIEVTTFRGEGDYLDGRRPSTVTFHSNLEDDLARRDFTMNALAYDPIGHEFQDPFEGRADIQRCLIRAVGDPLARFREDGLRPLRAVRFAAQLEFTLERRTQAAIPSALDVVRQVSAERVADEIQKLVTVPDPRQALQLLDRSGLLSVVFPLLAGQPRRKVSQAIAATGFVGLDVPLRLAALLHVLTPADAMRSVVTLRLPNRLAVEVNHLVRELGGFPKPFAASSDAALRGWLAQVGASRAPALLELHEAIVRSRGRRYSTKEWVKLRQLRRRVEQELRKNSPLSMAELALNGHEVMDLLRIPAGREVGEALQYLLAQVIEDPNRNTPEGLREALEGWVVRQSQGGKRLLMEQHSGSGRKQGRCWDGHV